MVSINNLNVNQMIYLLVLKENDFSPFNAGLDLNKDGANVCRMVKQIESYFDYPLFVKGDKPFYGKGKAIVGFTQEGLELYFSIKTFIDSIMLIGKDNENIRS